MSAILGNSLLAASLLLGQPASTPPASKQGEVVQVQNNGPTVPMLQPPQPQPQPTRPILGFFRNEERPIWTKLTSWFKRDNQEQPQPMTTTQPLRGGTVIRETTPPPVLNSGPTPSLTPGDFPRRMPSPSSKITIPEPPVAKETGKQIQQTTVSQVAVPRTKSPIKTELANRIGRDEKFEWITGQFEIENGNPVLYYATPETVDKYHGRIVLATEQTDLKQYRRGDLLSVRGTVSQRQTMQGIVPTYHVTMASLIERPKQ
jgi:hypothetical protein